MGFHPFFSNTVSLESHSDEGRAYFKTPYSNELDTDDRLEFACVLIAENHGSVRRGVTLPVNVKYSFNMDSKTDGIPILISQNKEK